MGMWRDWGQVRRVGGGAATGAPCIGPVAAVVAHLSPRRAVMAASLACRAAASLGQRALATVASGSTTAAVFATAEEHLASLAPHTPLPAGFRVGTHGFTFRPRELPDKPAKMTMTLLACDRPVTSFAAMFTSNAYPGAPVVIGRRRLAEPSVRAVIINNKISNVCAPGGVEDSERVCAEVGRLLGCDATAVIPSSTGVIGWKLPVDDIVSALPSAVSSLQGSSILPAATGIMTTDMYPKVRSATLPGCDGRIVGIAKGAGMIEPNLATMLVYLLTDIDVPREALRAILPRAVSGTFNCLSIDSDMSTSDTVVALSSQAKPLGAASLSDFEAALTGVCARLSEDIVRNGEGVQHVMRVVVRGAPTSASARAVGKSIVNSPLFKCAVAGNDPNVGRLVAAIGKCIGSHPDALALAAAKGTSGLVDTSRSTISMGGINIFQNGTFMLTPDTEKALVAHLKAAQLWESRPTVSAAATPTTTAGGRYYRGEEVSYHAPVHFPPHERMVEIEVHLGMGDADATVLGSDLTHEYVSVNADYRS